MEAPCPALLYCHAHGNAYAIGKDEVIDGRPALSDPPLGLHLARQGFVVLCPDLPGFGERQSEGSESALAKAALWQGRCLLGDMLSELAAAFDALAVLPEVDAGRIGTLGFSMGATLAYWLGALDPRVAAVAHLCAFAQVGGLIAAGEHDRHGPYMTVPGLLAEADMADVAALIAPRPQLVGAGSLDPLTPPAALDPALDRLRVAYADVGDRLTIVIEPDGGHAESDAMRNAVTRFLTSALAPPRD
jgi:dienelactone hydrolase